MPKLDIDMFEDEPKVGDRVKVMGKVKSIDDDSGMVEVSYDDVSIVRKKRKDRRNRDDDDDDDDDVLVVETMEDSNMSNSQSLDQALSQAFPQTQ